MGIIKGMPNKTVNEILDAFGLKGIKNVCSFKLVMEPASAAYIELGMYAEGEQIEKLKPLLVKMKLSDPKEVKQDEEQTKQMVEVIRNISSKVKRRKSIRGKVKLPKVDLSKMKESNEGI